MENILKETHIVEQILRRLNEVAPIPNEGFLAGGAVANTLLGMKYGDIEYPVNDLDIYIEEDPNGKTRESGAPLRSDNLIVEDGYWGGTIGYDQGTTYRIVSVERDGLYNYINISAIINRSKSSNPTYILKGFDLNCCQVGIDLSTNTLYYTPQFEEFMKTKQLDVTSVYTPAHTAIRLFKKKKELNCYCNVEACMELLSQPLIPSTTIRLLRGGFGIYFSDKYKDMFIRHYDELKHYFRMVRFFDHKRRLWDSRYEVRKQFQKGIPDLSPDHAVNWLDPHRTPPQELLEQWATLNDKLWTLIPSKYLNPQPQINKILKGTTPNPISFMSAYHLISGKIKKTILKKAELIMEKGTYTKLLSLVNPDFYNCDFTTEHILYIDEVMKKNQSLSRFIGKYEMNLQQTLTFVNDIERIIKKEGMFILGILTPILEEGNHSVLPTYNNMVKWVENKKKEMDKPLIPPQDLSGLELPYNIEVREIVSECQLQWAGQRLKNCLNNEGQGYAAKIQSGKVKVFLITTPKSTSAFEIFTEKNGLSYSVQQILSSCNKKPSLYHTVISQLLIMYLNKGLLKKVYESRLKNYEDIMFLNKGLLATTPDLPTKDNEICYGDVIRGAGDFGVTEEEVVEPEPQEGPELRNLYGRGGNLIGEELVALRPGDELVAPRPETIGDLVALQDLRDHLNEMENRNPLTEEVEMEVPLGHYLTNVDTENLEIEEEIDPNDTDRFIL